MRECKKRDVVVYACVFYFLVTNSLRSYDYDTDPQKRLETPDHYGYIPDEASTRMVLLFCMTVNSALLLLVRGFSAAALLFVDSKYFALYSLIEMGIYLLYKLLRRDFYYWMPLEGAVGIFLSLLMRIVVKVVTDFTGVLQFRGAAELGGIYWSMNSLIALSSCFVCSWVYFNNRKGAGLRGGDGTEFAALNTTLSEETEGFALNEDDVWLGLRLASCGVILSFAIILKLMKKKYRKTFFSTEKGWEWACKFFLNGKNDEMKMNIFGCKRDLWRSIEGDVRLWTLSNWWKWKREQPDWFTDSLISRIPDAFVPEEEDREVLQEARRKSSALGGSVKMLVGLVEKRRKEKERSKIGAGGGEERKGSATVGANTKAMAKARAGGKVEAVN
jgi:hypothetical protein